MLNIFFLICYMQMRYDFFLSLRDIVVCKKTRYFSYNFLFSIFWRKLCILVPDLYLYNIKIQTNINENSVEKYAIKS